MVVRVTNAGPDADTLHVLPTAWFRNTWSWDARRTPSPRLRGGADGASPSTTRSSASSSCWSARRPTAPTRRCCSARTRPTRRASTASPTATPYPKDGINDHVVAGAATVNPDADGHEGRVLVPARRRRRRARSSCACACARRRRAGDGRASRARRRLRPKVAAQRRREADEFYAELTPAGTHAGRGRWSCARRSPGCCGASSCTTTTSSAGWPATRPSRRRRRRA